MGTAAARVTTARGKARPRSKMRGGFTLKMSHDTRRPNLQIRHLNARYAMIEFAAEYRQQIVELARAGRTPAQLAREFGPTAQSIANWIAQDGRDRGKPLPGKEGLSTAEREELVRLRRESGGTAVHRAPTPVCRLLMTIRPKITSIILW